MLIGNLSLSNERFSTNNTIITLKKHSENDIPKQYRVKLNEFQLEMAYQALSTYNVPVTASIRETTEIGGI